MNYFEKFGYGSPRLTSLPDKNLFLSVVIPSYNEQSTLTAIQSLFDCDPPQKGAEVIVVVNATISSLPDIHARNKKTIDEINNWKEKNNRSGFNLSVIEESAMPDKQGGVGLARKIGMDEAAYRFNQINSDGIIICFDADCTCDKNYLTEIEKQFNEHKANAASIYFEHPLKGNEFDKDIYNAIIDYELFLRYYINGLCYANYPFAFHTIGSSMAVRSSVYQKQGGMNKRKAGEDFYFLHKVIPLGNFIEINNTRVIPSPRPSDRVPFGTGKAVNKWLEKKEEEFKSYSLKIFKELKLFFEMIPDVYEKGGNVYDSLPQPVRSFMSADDFKIKIDEIRNNSKTYDSFRKRFFVWWDGFMVLKFVHFTRDNFFPDVSLSESVSEMINKKSYTSQELLMELRAIQRKSPLAADFHHSKK